MKEKALIHARGDSVAVATDDISRDEEIVAEYIEEGGAGVRVRSREEIGLGHKIALKNIKTGERVVEYGEVIGAAKRDIAAGDHVHTHNIQSLRWGDLQRATKGT